MADRLNELYCEKRKTTGELVRSMPDHCCMWIDIALGQPREIIEEIAASGKPVTVHNMLDIYPMPWYSEDTEPGNGVSWFSGSGARRTVNAGLADIMPCYYREIPRLLKQREEIDTFCAAAAPMDRHGYFSLGLTGSASEQMIQKASKIYLEVNRQMPRALNAPMIHISQVTAFCESDYKLPEIGAAEPDEVSRKIGDLIAEYVPDGATIQLGIGGIPNAVGNALKSRKHLGIHTEMLTDSMIDLLECGAADNSRKPIHMGKTVTTFAYGSRKMYDYIDDNPSVEILPVDYVNNPEIIAQHPDFISINSAIEVDFYGQVCAESVGTRHMSGTGGQVDYVRGAVNSQGGKSFIAFPSTAKGGEVSRIRPTLTPGAIVTTGKNDVDYLVTEYGVAKMRGRTLSERAKALIQIAHPKFREELLFEARKQGILI